MTAEHVPRHGKAGVAFAGAELKDAWFLIASVFMGLVLGSVFGWAAYAGFPLLGYLGTKIYIDWKSRRLPGYFAELSYRLGVSGYSSAFDRKKKLFIGDGRVVNPAALQMGAVVRAQARGGAAAGSVDTSAGVIGTPAEDDGNQPVN